MTIAEPIKTPKLTTKPTTTAKPTTQRTANRLSNRPWGNNNFGVATTKSTTFTTLTSRGPIAANEGINLLDLEIAGSSEIQGLSEIASNVVQELCFT